jgi:hypothetical protein
MIAVFGQDALDIDDSLVSGLDEYRHTKQQPIEFEVNRSVSVDFQGPR